MKGKGGGAPIGNKNAAGRHKGGAVKKAPIPDTRSKLQKVSQSALGIKRDETTGRLFVGKSLAAAVAHDKAVAKRYNKYKSQSVSTPGKIAREVIFAVKR